MTSGELDRQIIIQARIAPENGYGEPVETWITEATVWAKVTPVRPTERYAAQQTMGEIDTKFRIRYRDNLNEKRNRISYNGMIYDIQPPIEIGRREGLDIYAKGRRA